MQVFLNGSGPQSYVICPVGLPMNLKDCCWGAVAALIATAINMFTAPPHHGAVNAWRRPTGQMKWRHGNGLWPDSAHVAGPLSTIQCMVVAPHASLACALALCPNLACRTRWVGHH